MYCQFLLNITVDCKLLKRTVKNKMHLIVDEKFYKDANEKLVKKNGISSLRKNFIAH